MQEIKEIMIAITTVINNIHLSNNKIIKITEIKKIIKINNKITKKGNNKTIQTKEMMIRSNRTSKISKITKIIKKISKINRETSKASQGTSRTL